MHHNRRTSKEDQKNLSQEAKLEWILKFGDFDQIIDSVKKNNKKAYEVFQTRTQKDLLIPEKRKNFLLVIFWFDEQLLLYNYDIEEVLILIYFALVNKELERNYSLEFRKPDLYLIQKPATFYGCLKKNNQMLLFL